MIVSLLLRSTTGERNYNLAQAEKSRFRGWSKSTLSWISPRGSRMRVPEPSRASFPEDGPRAKKSALQRKFHHHWGKFNLFLEGNALFFLKNVHLRHRSLIRDLFPVPREYRKPNFRARTSRKCYGRLPCFVLPKIAMENSVGIDLKVCTLTDSGFKLKENELSHWTRPVFIVPNDP